MNRIRRISPILAVLLVFSLLLSACGMLGGKTTGAVVTMTELSEPPNLDSAKSTDAVSFTILNNVMEGLYRTGKNGIPVLGIAAGEPTVSADKLTYTFKLRDAKWSDGKPVTAHDFEYAWKRALDPTTASEYAYILYAILNAQAFNTGKGTADSVGVKALDDKTLQVKLATPTPFLKDLLGFPTYLPQRKDIVEKFGSKYGLEASNLVYDGPFILSDWRHSQSFQYTKNKGYWDQGTVKLSVVNVDIVKDVNTSMNLYNTNKVDYTELQPEFMATYQNSPDKIVIKEATATYLELNEANKLFANAKIRKAISLAIDKASLVNNVFKMGQPAGGIVVPGIKTTSGQEFRTLAPAPVQYDPAQAKTLWADGLKELGMATAPAFHVLGDDTPRAQTILQFLKEQFRTNLGLNNVVLDSVPFKDRLQRTSSGNFDIVIFNWGADYNDPMTFLDLWTTDSTYNSGKWSNAQYDALIKKSKTNTNYDQRTKDLITAEKILIDQVGVVPVMYRSRAGLLRHTIKDLPFHVIGPTYSLKWAHY